MNQDIVNECIVLMEGVKSGVILSICYDILRTIRRIIKHNELFIAIEDLVFFVLAGLYIFATLFENNNGIVRTFIIIGMIVGAYLFNSIIGKYLVKYISHFINMILKIIKKSIKMSLKLKRKGDLYEKQKDKERQKI